MTQARTVSLKKLANESPTEKRTRYLGAPKIENVKALALVVLVAFGSHARHGVVNFDPAKSHLTPDLQSRTARCS